MPSNIDIIRDGYEAFGRGDVPAVLAIFADDIEWYAPDELPGGGTFHGPGEVAGFFGALPGIYDDLRVEPDRLLDAGDQVIAEGHHRGRIGGQPFEVGFAHVWTLAGGRVVRFREYMDSGKLIPLLAKAST
ncbi:nuclear transport factor 2 family protein [Pseudonocardia sp. GCM10023141]|uniref:nuclear transport factor 2 family protein n=1 Tax=Pseudonocardia sp. GCM10023141 TaxID=3252653 RepID=UPI0036237645